MVVGIHHETAYSRKEESTDLCESSQAEEASSRLSERPRYLCRFFPHNEAYFSTLLTELPLVSLTLEPGPIRKNGSLRAA